MPDTTHLKTYMKKHVSYPMIIVQNTKTDSIYRLSCFDDMKWDINELNEGNPEYLYKADPETYKDVKSLIEENHVNLWYSQSGNKLIEDSKKWNIYFVSGIFLGKKLRRLSFPATNLKDVDQFNIIDLSVNKE